MVVASDLAINMAKGSNRTPLSHHRNNHANHDGPGTYTVKTLFRDLPGGGTVKFTDSRDRATNSARGAIFRE